MTIYLNTKKKTRKGGRKTTDPSMKSLTHALYSFFKKNEDIIDEDMDEYFSSEKEMIHLFDSDPENNLYSCKELLFECFYDVAPSKDLLKIDGILENVIWSKSEVLPFMEKDQLGFKTLSNGLAVLQCCGWTDSAFPVFFILYFDGKKLRGYIPVKGNTYNSISKTCLGEDYMYTDKDFLKKEGISDSIFDIMDQIAFHMPSIEEDIMDRIEIC